MAATLTSASFKNRKKLENLIMRFTKAAKVVGIPRDECLFISEDADHHYTVTMTNDMRELISTTHITKS